MVSNSEILTALKNHLRQGFGDKIEDVILFGSQTKSTQHEYSDYDILIVLDGNYSRRDENQIMDLCYDIDLQFNIMLDIHILSNSELKSVRGRQPVFANAIKSGIYA